MLYFLPKRFTEFKNWVVRQKLGGDHSAVNGMRKKRSFITKLDLLT